MIKNAKEKPKLYFGLHMAEGTAQYTEGAKSEMIFIDEDTIKNMDPSFQGCPVFVEHVDDVDLDKIQEEADGYVVRSFFNKSDGKHWVEFIVVSDKAHQAIRNGWKLSNAYVPKDFAGGGQWHGMDYNREVKRAEYEHLALVRNPRYAESIILTPEEFKEYCSSKELELTKIANSKEEKNKMSKLKFWNRKPAENTADLESLSVVLPKSGKELTITQLVNAMDDYEEKQKENMADPKHMVKLHDGSTCNVGDLVEKHKALHDELAGMKKNDEVDEEDAEVVDKPVDVESVKENEEEDKAKEEKAGDDKEDKEKKKNNFDKIANAHKNKIDQEVRIDLMEDQVARGKARYGSN